MGKLPLHTIKSKLTFALVAFICAQAAILVFLSHGAYNRYKNLVIYDYRSTFRMETQQLNSTITRLQEDAEDLALVGEVFRRLAVRGSDDDGFLRQTLLNFFNERRLGMGGGLWFFPYAVYPDRESVSYFLYRKGDRAVFDDSYLEDPHNYLKQDWYITLKEKLAGAARDTAWTKPYVDVAASRSRMITIGSAVHDDDEQPIGMATIDWDMTRVMDLIEEMRVIPGSFTTLAAPGEGYVLATNDPNSRAVSGSPLSELKWYGDGPKNEGRLFYNGEHYVTYIRRLDNGMELIANLPEKEMFRELWQSLGRIIAAYMIAAVLSTILVYFLLNRLINRPVRYLSEKVHAIGAGDLNTEIRLDSDDELGRLAGSFSTMTTSLREHVENLKSVTAERERIGAELGIAKEIQTSFLPRTFPAFPGRDDFDLYAEMHPAKEVGGDFYDFFLVDENHLAVVVADVSGKGVPAALYMVVAKTLINNHARGGLGAAGIFREANARLCENEDMGMFVTAFLGILDVRTGKMTYANAGHNPPVLLRHGAPAARENIGANLVLGVMEDTRYQEGSLILERGDTLLLYTDGVTEAENMTEEMFGMQRFLASADRWRDPEGGNLRKLVDGIRGDVDAFAAGAPQFDDITLLALLYNNSKG